MCSRPLLQLSPLGYTKARGKTGPKSIGLNVFLRKGKRRFIDSLVTAHYLAKDLPTSVNCKILDNRTVTQQYVHRFIFVRQHFCNWNSQGEYPPVYRR